MLYVAQDCDGHSGLLPDGQLLPAGAALLGYSEYGESCE
jgi:hypothetical protein